MKDVTLRQMEYLVAVIDTGSVSAGAQACHVSQATVSSALAALERALACTLLLRGPARRALPTPEGLAFGNRARAVLAAAQEAVESVDSSLTELRGPLSVGCMDTVSPRILPGLVEHFTQTWPEVDLRLRESDPFSLQEQVAAGALDVAVMYERQVRNPSLERFHLADVQLHAMLPADSPLANGDSVALADLASMPCILLDIPPTQELLLERIHALGLQVDVRWTSSSAETIRSLVARGLGFSLINAVPHPDARSFEGLPLAYLPLSDEKQANPAVALTAPGRRRSARIDEALHALRRVAQDSSPGGW